MSREHEQPHHPRHTPPWWPEGEPWPPVGSGGRQHWRGMRGRFVRRIGCAFVLLITWLVAMVTAVVWLAASSFGMINLSEGTLAVLRLASSLVLVAGLAGMLLAGWALRRAALPIGDLVEAVGRVTEGDYAVRLPERGPREIRRLAGRFNRMTERLQVDDEQRRSRLADVSHELRTPLTVIQGELEGILDGVYSPDSERIQSILDETHVLSRLIDDLHILSQAESGALKLQLERADIRELIEEAAAAFEGQAGASGLQLKVQAQPDLPEVEIDPTRIREVIANLVSNALRYSPAGSQVTLRAWVDSEESDRLHIAVSDQGSGISPEDMPHIFERFYKSAESPGAGLGLAIAKGLVHAHGGEISAQSEPGRGTTIEFTLPLSGV